MKNATASAWNNVRQLIRFLFWYAVAAAAVLYLLPLAGLFLESHYDELSSAAKLLVVIGFVSVVAAWQWLVVRDRRRA